ncbi:phage tail tube protein [Salipiger marinus]|uniref:phage tail tube protein n=1 Tax=Salipiger marinus TaxID=555512 RepID=UPI002CC667DD|nr:phage tail tube protein [Salipiger manganoxidans]MEB3419903.1 phage tail tube protein [Salipiger manganoxidans]
MAGTASSQLRSAHILEATPGTIPATPAFTTLHAPARLTGTPQTLEGRSLVAKGGRLGRGINGIDVTGTLEDSLKYGVYDHFLATLLQGTWSSDVLKDGKAQTTVAVENALPAGVGGTSTMMRFRGVEAVSGTLNLTARQAAALNLTLAGLGSDDATTTAITGATYTDPTVVDPLSSGADVGTIVFEDITLDCMQSLEINFAFEGRDLQPKISSNDLCGITRGDFLPVLTANIYLEANFLEIYNAARARHDPFSVTIPLGSVTGEKYTIEFPRCHFASTSIDTTGTAAMQNVTIHPEYSTSDSATVIITRAVA